MKNKRVKICSVKMSSILLPIFTKFTFNGIGRNLAVDIHLSS